MSELERLKARLTEEIDAMLAQFEGPGFSEAAAKCHATIDELNALDPPSRPTPKGEPK